MLMVDAQWQIESLCHTIRSTDISSNTSKGASTMSGRESSADSTISTQKPDENKITDEMALEYAVFLYNLYRKAKSNYN